MMIKKKLKQNIYFENQNLLQKVFPNLNLRSIYAFSGIVTGFHRISHYVTF